jgi:lipopolysaccharide/colanic/teichoic acid biosynthesis glycosyltransferase
MVWAQISKRAFDMAASVAALIVLSPLILAVALAIRIIDGPPVLFHQRRSGRRGAPFNLHKFRTMRSLPSSSPSTFDPSTDAVRLTKLGRWLRGSSLDELPTLLNVARGDMSLVGPRPLPEEYLERYSPDQRRRLEVRPGITGLAQVRGRNLLTWEERFALDVQYVEGRSLLGDLRLIVDTVAPVLRHQGVSAAGEATMTEFLGSPGPGPGLGAGGRPDGPGPRPA